MKPHTPSDPDMQVDALDGVRGFAALLVFLSHADNQDIGLLGPLDLSGVGKPGVFLFFLLSSFLLSRPFLKRDATPFTRNFLTNYFVRRVTRIYPLYFCYLGVSFISTALLWKVLGGSEPVGAPLTLDIVGFLRQVFLLQGEGVSWSIVVEFKFYFILPAVAFLITRLKCQLLPSLLLTAFLVAVSVLVVPSSERFPNDIRLIPYVPIFFSGFFVALVWTRFPEWVNTTGQPVIRILGWLSSLVLILMIPSVYRHVFNPSISDNHFHNNYLLFGILWSPIICWSMIRNSVAARFFRLPALRWMGFFSFSLYLWHTVFIHAFLRFGEGIPSVLKGWLALAVSIGFSWLSYRLIELPASQIRWKNGLLYFSRAKHQP